MITLKFDSLVLMCLPNEIIYRNHYNFQESSAPVPGTMDNFDSVSLMNLPDEIEEFFSKEEFAEMSEYEKDRYKNIRVNYEMMIAVGKPHYMCYCYPLFCRISVIIIESNTTLMEEG